MDLGARPSLGPDERSADRSSLGILNLDSMSDLSSSMLHYELDAGNTRAASPRQPNAGLTDPARTSADSAVRSWAKESAAIKRQTNSAPMNIAAGQRFTPSDGASGRSEKAPADVPMMLFGSPGDVDQSLHEVQIDEAELQMLEEEFSDLGDFSVNNIDDQDDANSLSDHENALDSFAMDEKWAMGESSQDVRVTTGKSVSESTVSDLSHASSALWEKQLLTLPGQGHESLRGQGRESLRDIRGQGGEFQGEGQEDEVPSDSLSMPAPLDSIYLHETSYPGGQDSDLLTPGLRVRGSGVDSIPSSEMDTEDELEVVRREASKRQAKSRSTRQRDSVLSERQEAVGQSLSMCRPGLEGGNVDLSDLGGASDVRQGADGEMVYPVPGDGGGGGDGSSGHDSESDSLLSSNPPTTYDVLRGLGFLQPRSHDPIEEDDPEAQQRIRPMGDDLLYEVQSAAHPGLDMSAANPSLDLSDPADIRSRLLSGASFDQDASLQGGDNDDSRLASMFLKPSVPYNESSSTISEGPNPFTGDLMHAGTNMRDSREWGSAEDAGKWGSDGYMAGDEDAASCGFDKGKIEFSQLEPSGSPVSGRSSEGRISGRSSEGQGHFTSDKPSKGSDPHVVFIDKSGDAVTDLAFHTSFDVFASEQAEMFDIFAAGEPGAFDADLNDPDLNFSAANEDFISAEVGKAILDKDEEQFLEENVFAETDALDEPPPPTSGNSSMWSVYNMTHLTRPSFMEDVSQLRISIGAFMGSRTEALGSLDGDPYTPRPDFGTEILTPPDNRKPITLLRLSDIHEMGMTSADEARSSGVGSHVEGEFENPEELTPKAVSKEVHVEQFISPPLGGSAVQIGGGGKESLDSQQSTLRNTVKEAETPELKISDLEQSASVSRASINANQSPYIEQMTKSLKQKRINALKNEGCPRSPPLSESEDEGGSTQGNNTTLGNRTGILHVSTISKLISDVSMSANPEELADLILKMSNAKTLNDKKKKSVSLDENQKPNQEKTNGKEMSKSNEGQGLKVSKADDFLRANVKAPLPSTQSLDVSKSRYIDSDPSSGGVYQTSLSESTRPKDSLATTIRPPRRTDSDPKLTNQAEAPLGDSVRKHPNVSNYTSDVSNQSKDKRVTSTPAQPQTAPSIGMSTSNSLSKDTCLTGAPKVSSNFCEKDQLLKRDKVLAQPGAGVEKERLVRQRESGSSISSAETSTHSRTSDQSRSLRHSQSLQRSQSSNLTKPTNQQQAYKQTLSASRLTPKERSKFPDQYNTMDKDKKPSECKASKEATYSSQRRRSQPTQESGNPQRRDSTDSNKSTRSSVSSRLSTTNKGQQGQNSSRGQSSDVGQACERSQRSSVMRTSDGNRRPNEKGQRSHPNQASFTKQMSGQKTQPNLNSERSHSSIETKVPRYSSDQKDHPIPDKYDEFSRKTDLHLDLDAVTDGKSQDSSDTWGTPRRSMIITHSGLNHTSPSSQHLVAEFEALVRGRNEAKRGKTDENMPGKMSGVITNKHSNTDRTDPITQKHKNESTPPIARRASNQGKAILDKDQNSDVKWNNVAATGEFKNYVRQQKAYRDLVRTESSAATGDNITPRDSKQMLSHQPCLASTPYIKDFPADKSELESPSHILPPSNDASARVINSTDTTPRKLGSYQNTPVRTSGQDMAPRRLTGVDSTPHQFIPSLSSTTAETPYNHNDKHSNRLLTNEKRLKSALDGLPLSRDDNSGGIRESTGSIISGMIDDDRYSNRSNRDQYSNAAPVSSFQHNLAPPKSFVPATTSTPTLLTSQPLSRTAFAAGYLSRKGNHGDSLSPVDVVSGSSPAGSFLTTGHSGRSSSLTSVTQDVSPSVMQDMRSLPSCYGEPSMYLSPSSSVAGVITSSVTSVTPTSMHNGCVVSPSVSANRLTRTDGQLDQIMPGRQGNKSSDLCMSAPQTLTPMLEAPSELRIPGICCVDLSCHSQLPIHNPTSRWLQASLKLVALSVDGEDRDREQQVPFILKEKVIIEPYTTQDVKVIFAPKHAGVYVAHLHVIASSLVEDRPNQPERLPTMVTIQALAELPSVQIYTDSGPTLDFGQVPWGSRKAMTITLTNRGRCTVPLRLAISSITVWSCFTFERQSVSDVSVISGTSVTSAPTISNSVINLILPGNDRNEVSTEPVKVIVYFRAPNKAHDRAHAQLPPEEFRAQLEVEVDTPIAPPTLGSVQLRAEAGVVRLHTLQTMETILLKAELGQSMSTVVPLRNAGNISLLVTLDVTDWPDTFSVLPSRLMVAPSQEAEVILKFEPTESSRYTYQSFLVMSVEPEGPAFEVTLRGELGRLAPPPAILAPPPSLVSPPMPIFSNKMYLAWGGVRLGRALQQSLKLRNNSDQMLKLKLQLRGNTHDFQLQSLFGHQEKLSDSREIILKPKEDYPVNIVFAPTRVATFTSKLSVRHNRGTTKYSIPLCGYGGTASLIMEGLKAGQKNVYWTNVGQVRPTQNIVCKLMVRNTGSRAAFVKTLAFTDLSCKTRVIGNRVTIQPSEFCLRKDESKTVIAILNPSEVEASQCKEKANMIGVVAFLYGDEACRQMYRRALRSNRANMVELADENPLKQVNFDVQYQDEQLAQEEILVQETNSDVEIFFGSISRMMVSLIGDRRASVPHSMGIPATKRVNCGSVNEVSDNQSSLSEKTLSGSLKITKQPVTNGNTSNNKDNRNKRHALSYSPPVKGTPAPHHALAGYKKGLEPSANEKSQSWTIKPTQVIVPAPKTNSDENIKKIQITNYSQRVIQYDLVWPGHCLQVTPERGSIAPRSLTTVCVSASSSLYSKGVPLPWSGQILVMCEGQNQILKVQIREDVAMDDSIYPSSKSLYPLIPQPDTPTVTMPTSTTPAVSINNQDIKFPVTDCKQSSEAVLELKNNSSEVANWTVSSFAPAYVKKSETSKDVYRVTHTVFRFPVRMGSLQPYEETKVVVSFSPQDVGLYSQCWELESQSPSSGSASSRIQLSGQASFSGQVPVAETRRSQGSSHVTAGSTKRTGQKAANQNKSLSAQDNFNNTKHRRGKASDRSRHITVDSDRISFPVTAAGKSSIHKLRLLNVSSSESIVEVVHVQPPFHVKANKFTIQGKFYMNYPVEFRPTKPGSYESLLVLRYGLDCSIGVHLSGQS